MFKCLIFSFELEASYWVDSISS